MVREKIERIEKRFKEIQTAQIDKFKSKKYGEVFTPNHLARKMIDKVDDYSKIKKTLDLCAGHGVFTLELIKKYYEIQKDKFDLDKFFQSHYCSEIQEESVTKLKYIFGEQLNIIAGDSRGIKDKFDLCFSNPPYNRGVDLKILKVIEPLCDEMVIVHPSTWLIDLKKIHKPYKVFMNQIEGTVRSVELFNGNPVFGIALFVPCVILHTRKDYNGEILGNYFGQKFKAESLSEITKFGKEWKAIVKPFMQKIKDYISENDSIWDKRVLEL